MKIECPDCLYRGSAKSFAEPYDGGNGWYMRCPNCDGRRIRIVRNLYERIKRWLNHILFNHAR